jgi:signal transduction histidine kinase
MIGLGLRWIAVFAGLIGLAALPDATGETTFAPVELAIIGGALGGLLIAEFLTQRGRQHPVSLSEREVDAERLRTARERTQLIYEMASQLGASLNYERVLNTALDIGVLGLRKIADRKQVRLISAVLLFQGHDLKIVSARGFTQADERLTLPARRGILGIAVNQSEPVFGDDPRNDPELQYFNGLVNAKSLLVLPLRAGFNKYGVLLFASEQPQMFTDESIELLNAIGTQATIAIQNATLYLRLREERDKLVQVEEDARKKLARDLHDGPVQTVAAVAMRSNMIRTMMTRKPEIIPDELAKVEELARQATKEIRHMLFTLRPLVLETQGLAQAFRQMSDKMRETYELNVVIEVQEGADTRLPPSSQGVLFYIVEEAVNNARKHAESEHIWVRLYVHSADFIICEIQDDGKGFDVAAVETGYDKRGSLGMINMRERAELAEGSVKVESARGKGTKITVLVPTQLKNIPDTEEE